MVDNIYIYKQGIQIVEQCIVITYYTYYSLIHLAY